MAGDREDKTMIKRIVDLVPQEKKMRAVLVVISGSAVGKIFPLPEGEAVIGRAGDNEITVDDDGVSRRHAKVVLQPNGEVRIVDMGSTNGTYYNGNRVDMHTLRDGDKIQIGSTTILKFSYQDTLDESYHNQLYDSATRDGLTKIFNRRYFSEHFQSEFSYSLRHKQLLALALFDIDHFKKINDTHGHAAGDYVLRHLASAVQATVRREDTFARYGGEEFVCILRDLDDEKAYLFGLRVRKLVESTKFNFEGRVIPVTISIGVGTLTNANFASAEQMIKCADAFLYAAKHGGRNRVESILTTTVEY